MFIAPKILKIILATKLQRLVDISQQIVENTQFVQIDPVRAVYLLMSRTASEIETFFGKFFLSIWVKMQCVFNALDIIHSWYYILRRLMHNYT